MYAANTLARLAVRGGAFTHKHGPPRLALRQHTHAPSPKTVFAEPPPLLPYGGGVGPTHGKLCGTKCVWREHSAAAMHACPVQPACVCHNHATPSVRMRRDCATPHAVRPERPARAHTHTPCRRYTWRSGAGTTSGACRAHTEGAARPCWYRGGLVLAPCVSRTGPAAAAWHVCDGRQCLGAHTHTHTHA